MLPPGVVLDGASVALGDGDALDPGMRESSGLGSPLPLGLLDVADGEGEAVDEADGDALGVCADAGEERIINRPAIKTAAKIALFSIS